MKKGIDLSSVTTLLITAAVGYLAYRQFKNGEQNVSNQDILSQKLTSIEESVSGIKAGVTAFTPILNNIAGDTASTKQQLADLRTELVNKGVDQSIIDRVTQLDDSVNSIEDGVASARTQAQTIADSVEDVPAPADPSAGGETPTETGGETGGESGGETPTETTSPTTGEETGGETTPPADGGGTTEDTEPPTDGSPGPEPTQP